MHVAGYGRLTGSGSLLGGVNREPLEDPVLRFGGISSIWGEMSEMATLAETSDLEAVYRRDGSRLWRALVAYCGNRDVADEAVAEAYAQALRRGDKIRHPDRWVWRAAFRIAAGDLQRRQRSLPLDDIGLSHNPEPAWDLIEALGVIPPKQRACVVLRYYCGYSSIEIARITDSTPPAVRMQLSRGRKRLRSILGGGESDA
jgi:RNA polymerase sigma-70 factor (ECF subfamily)